MAVARLADPALAAGWLEALWERRSRRSYDGIALGAEALEALAQHCETFRPFDTARVVLIPSAPQALFLGILGSYGGVSNAPSALAFIGRAGEAGVDAAIGYTGEAAVLEASRLGLATCWIGGLFDPAQGTRLAGARSGERLFAVSPLGHAVDRISMKERVVFGLGRPKRRKDVAEFAPGSDEWPTWARAAAAAVQVAPSAMHRQPWKLRLEEGALVIGCEGLKTPKVSRRLDCGIAMLHAELGALGEGVEGDWELLDGDDVGRFAPR
ncbi:MAG: nitroreductase family protein [Actinomycetota bacterium]|nr:MAG: hypothetical protein FD171_1339 [Actinomycetota bacterium]MDP3629384.1 nitroreductase family protein [Actinomycetota bacterium]